MGLDYDKFKQNQDNGTQWSSYSDLFMVLSLVFLLLYVTSSLKGGTYSIQKHIEYQKLRAELDEQRAANRAYEALKDDYVEKQASQSEQEVYRELMAKLDLLQDEARQEKEELRKKAAENEKTERALNKYQQIIKNIINTNMLARVRIERKEKIIQEKEDIIVEKQQIIRDREQEIAVKRGEIENMVKAVDEKKKKIEEGEKKISKIQETMAGKIEEFQRAHRRNQISKTLLNKKIKELEEASENSIHELQGQNQQISQQLQKVNSDLEKAQTSIEAKDQERMRLELEMQNKLASVTETYQDKLSKLQTAHKLKLAKEKRAFEESLEKQQLSARARAEKEAEFRKNVEKQTAEMKQQMASLKEKVGESQKALKKAKELINARKNLAAQIQNNFAKNGIKAEVDGETGDVVLSFGKEYFDTGSSRLKKGMEDKLREFMPTYSSSLFSDPKTAKKIETVEIIGFASPTYKGKYVDPNSLNEEDRRAVNFNLDLSYNRAKSIFTYIFDRNKMQYPHQKKLLPIVKVTGRSFLAEAAKGRGIASGTSQKEYCEKFNCKQDQKVIIKFNLRD